ncbi:MAG: YceI family protein [Phycisphaerales bacterium]|nr:YceI family protein [Phycisphaerales bacterium]
MRPSSTSRSIQRSIRPVRCLLAAAALGGAGLVGGFAATAQPAATSAATSAVNAAAPLDFKLDPVHCMALFRIHHVGAGRFWGMFDQVGGTMTYAEDGKTAPTFDVTVQVESVHSGTEKLDRTIIGPQFFNAKEYETIRFVSTGGESTGDGTWNVTGDFTMHGVTKPVTARVEFTGLAGNPVQKKAGFEATFEVKRSDFGMDWGVKNKALGDDVRLVVGLEGDWTR